MAKTRPKLEHDTVEELDIKIPSHAERFKAEAEETLELDVDDLPVVDVDAWLGGDVEVPTKWIPLRTQKAKIQIKAMTEAERKALRKSAPKKKNRKTGQQVPDMEWIQLELVKRCIVEPKIPHQDLLNKTLAGELAYIAGEISDLSGFGMSELENDALE